MAKLVQEEKNYEYDKCIFRKIIKRVKCWKKVVQKEWDEKAVIFARCPEKATVQR